MEPGPGNDHNEPEYRNFLANKGDFIINYCAYNYLGNKGYNYQITDMAKGGIELKDAKKSQKERYKKWRDLLIKELGLLGCPKIIFVGKGLYDDYRWGLKVPIDNYILHHAGSNRGHVKDYYNSIKDIKEYEPSPKDIADIKEFAKKIMEEHNYNPNLIDKIIKNEFKKSFTEADERYFSVTRYDFERITKNK